MNTNLMFTTNLTNTFELNLTSNLMKTSSSKDFNEMFNSTINKFNENIKSVKNENETDFNVNNVDNKKDSFDSSIENKTDINKSEKIETKSNEIKETNLEEKDSSTINEMSDEEKEKLEKVAQEVLCNILELLNNPNVDLSEFVEVDSEGMLKVKLEGIGSLTEELRNILTEDVISRIDDSTVKSGLDLEKITHIALDFVVNEANAEMMKLDVNDLEINDVLLQDANVPLDSEIADEYYDVNYSEELKVIEEDVDNSKLEYKAKTDKIVHKDDNFEILKSKINELVDKIEVEEKTLVNENKTKEENSSKEMLINHIENADVENLNTDLKEDNMTIQNNISDDENMEVNNQMSDEHASDSKDGSENKDVERININKVENARNIDAEMFGQNFTNFEDISSAMHLKVEKQTVTDRFLESFNVAKQMVKGVEMKVTEATSEMSIQLDPENLGKVNLKIVTENGLVMAKFEAESQRVKEIIESNLSLLKESLENKGISISGLEVSVGQDMNRRSDSSSNLEYMRKIVSEKNPHKILGKTINKFNNYAEIRNSQNKSNGLFMTRSKINYIA